MILFGISNCDTVRKARKFLENNHTPFQFHDIRKDGLTLEMFHHWLRFQSLDVLINKRSASWKQLTDQQKQALTDGSDLSLLLEIPTLIKRPILQTQQHVLVGFKESEFQAVVDHNTY